MQALIPDTPTILIDVDPAGDSHLPFDLRIRGTEPEDEVIAGVVDLLVRAPDHVRLTAPPPDRRRTAEKSITGCTFFDEGARVSRFHCAFFLRTPA